MAALAALVKKEVLSVLRNPQIVFAIIIIPLMFMAMGHIGSVGMEEAARAAREAKIYIIDRDGTWLTKGIVEALSKAGMLANSPDEASIVIVLGEGFTEELIDTGRVEVDARARIPGFSIAASGVVSMLQEVASILGETARTLLAVHEGVPPRLLRIEVGMKAEVVYGNIVLSLEEAQKMLSIMISSGFVVAIVAALALQFGALSMAQEKEDKTFEMLLTQPVSRITLGVAKVVGVVILSVLEVAVFAWSWHYYVSSFAPAEGGGDAAEVLLRLLGPTGLALVLADTFIVMVAAAILGLVLGGFARDTRSAGVIVGPAWMLAMIAAFTVQMISLPRGLGYQLAMAATLVLGPVVVLNNSLLGDSLTVSLAMAVNAAEAAAFLLVLGRLFNSEALLIGLPFPLRRRGQGE